MTCTQFVFEKLNELDYEGLIVTAKALDFNPNKAGLFECSFSWEGVNLTLPSSPPSYFKNNLSNVNITLCNC